MNNLLRNSHKNKTDSLTGTPSGVLFGMLCYERGNCSIYEHPGLMGNKALQMA